MTRMTLTTRVRKQTRKHTGVFNRSGVSSTVICCFLATEESKERDAFGNFLSARKEVVQIRNRKCAAPDGC